MGFYARGGKRLCDIVLAGGALFVFSPLFAVLALLVARSSSGGVFFRQERVGLHGKPFWIMKFRSMIPNDGTGPLVTVSGDSRVTPIGRFLRKTKLDELPQLINVLKGEMSVIGPRPEVPLYVSGYSPLDRAVVLSVRPGLSDLASVRFHDEEAVLARYPDPLAAYRDHVLPKKLRYCRFYVRRMSLGLDVKLIFWTLGVVGRKT